MDMKNPPFSIGSHAESETADIVYYLRMFFHNKWKIFAFVFIVTSFVAAYVAPMDSVYEAKTTVMIEANGDNGLDLQNINSYTPRSREFFSTQYEIIQSRNLIAKVVDRLSLTTHPEYDPRQKVDQSFNLFLSGNKSFLKEVFGIIKEGVVISPEEEEAKIRRKIIDDFDLGLVVEPIPGTFLVSIGYQSNSPELAALIANTVADIYIESYLDARLSVAKKATTWLASRLDELRINLQNSEQNLQDYREKENLVDVSGVRTLDSAELAQLRSDFVEARQRRVQMQTIYEQVKGYENFSTNRLLGIPVLLANPIVRELVRDKGAADRRVVELSSRYGVQHPNMLTALSQQKEINDDLFARLQTVAQGIYADYQASLSSERNLSEQINQTQNRLQSVSRKEVRLRELEREVEANRQLYDLFLNRGKESGESSKLENPPVIVIDEAVTPVDAVGPPKSKYVLAAIIMSLAFSLGLIILLDFFDSTVRTSDDVEHKLKASMIGFLPLDKSNDSDFAFRAFDGDSDKGEFAEAMRTIRTSLVLSSLDAPFKTILITSSLPKEGKSTVSINIAEALGQMEKVLLIEADMRRPSLGKALGLSQSTIGLSNIISGKANVDDCTHRLPGSEVDVIVSGTIPDNPLELIGSKEFKEMLSSLQGQYDRIVIDSAPVNLVSDAQVLSAYADSILYIVKSNATSVAIASKGIKTLQSTGAPLTGVILNQLDVNKASQYDAYYGVYKEYSYSAESKA